MWLKVVTIFLMIFSIAMLFAYFWIVGPKPVNGTKAENLEFMRRGATFIGIEAVALIGSIVGAYLIARRAREEYREQSRRNMEALIESTLRDHAKKGEGADVD